MNKYLRAQYPLFFFIVILIASYSINKFYLINESVEVGSAYGFKIGASKKDSYQSAVVTLRDNPDTMVIYLWDGLEQKTTVSSLTLVPSEDHLSSDRWTIKIDDSYSNTIALMFSADRLARIDRQRRLIGP